MTDRQLVAAIALFPKFTALDAIGPYEVLQRIPTIDVVFVGHELGEVRSENGFLGITRDATFEDVPHPDVLVFPGGVGTRPLQTDQRVLEWVRTAHETSRFTTSVCTGSLVLGAAGLLDGLTATTHWATYPELEAHGAVATSQRVVEHLDQRIITAAGVSSGIDMALAPGRVARRPSRSRSIATDDRVRPAAPVRCRLARQGQRRSDDESDRIRPTPRMNVRSQA